MDKKDSFTRRIIIHKDLPTVFDSWTIQGEMENWFLKSAKFLRDDDILETGERARERDTYQWVWHTWPDNVQEGVVTSIVQDESFGFTFEPGGVVEVKFLERGESSTEIALTQSEILTDGEGWYHYFYGCSLGWSFWMVNLKAYLEHGIVLDQRIVVYQDERNMHMVNQ